MCITEFLYICNVKQITRRPKIRKKAETEEC
nr:MAG TPA: hypothetical protein [Caudoviricetes sp.]